MPDKVELTLRIRRALDIAVQYGQIDGDHHKAWTIDQMVRALTGCPKERRVATDYRGATYTFDALGESEEYKKIVREHNTGPDGDEDFDEWDTGIAP